MRSAGSPWNSPADRLSPTAIAGVKGASETPGLGQGLFAHSSASPAELIVPFVRASDLPPPRCRYPELMRSTPPARSLRVPVVTGARRPSPATARRACRGGVRSRHPQASASMPLTGRTDDVTMIFAVPSSTRRALRARRRTRRQTGIPRFVMMISGPELDFVHQLETLGLDFPGRNDERFPGLVTMVTSMVILPRMARPLPARNPMPTCPVCACRPGRESAARSERPSVTMASATRHPSKRNSSEASTLGPMLPSATRRREPAAHVGR